MKEKYIRVLLLTAVIIVFSTTNLLPVSNYNKLKVYAMENGSIINTAEKSLKDETVYGILNYDGAVDSIYVVNHFSVPENGIYEDYGDYTEVENLANNANPKVTGETIQWDLDKSTEGFYYKGLLKTKKLPWNFTIKYKLDGTSISGEKLAGKSGKVDISIDISPDEKANTYFTDNFAMQVQVPINLSNSTILSAEGATKVIAGKTATLTYMILPKMSKVYNISLKTDSFKMDSINIGLSNSDYSSLIDTKDITDGFNSLSNGMDGLVDGTSKLKNGMVELNKGISDMARGQNQLYSKGSDLIKGMENYNSGIKQFSSSITPLSEGSKKVNDALSQIAASGSDVANGYKQVAEALKSQLPTQEEKAQLQALAQYANSPDPTMAQMGNMAKSMLEQITGMEQLYATLNTLNTGLIQYTSGVSSIAGEYKNLNDGIKELPGAAKKLSDGYTSILDGNKQFMEGISTINNGMAALNKETKAVPNNIQNLIDGQEQIKDGIDEAKDSINDMLGEGSGEEKAISFAAPEKAIVNSVQFIFRTPSIAVSDKKSTVQEVKTEKKGFFQKLVDLFTAK